VAPTLDDNDLAELAGVAESLGLLRLGAVDLGHPGFARARAALADYLARDAAGEMQFIPRTAQIRMDPTRMFPAARSALVAVVPHGGESGPIARYAQSFDYHTEVHRRLERLREAVERRWPEIETLICVDTKPVLERSIALLSGLGFLGKNGCLIVPGLGSYLVIGVLLTSAEWVGRDRAPASLAEPDSAPWDACGGCRACLDHCPTDAFDEPGKLDPRRCISYLTIEHRGPIAESLAIRMGPRIAGCDVCQEVCPYNRSGVRDERIPPAARIGPPPGRPRVVDLPALAIVGNNQHRQFVKNTALNRIPRRALQRNAILAIANLPGPASAEEQLALEIAARDPTPEIAELARWAARRRGIAGPHAQREEAITNQTKTPESGESCDGAS
jgi:epoxyqueuosine reductase